MYQAAREGALLLDEGDEPGLTPAQALAADVAAKEAAGMVGAAASAGTIVAWMYGDGLADSGSAGAVDVDEVSLSARWVAIVGAAAACPLLLFCAVRATGIACFPPCESSHVVEAAPACRVSAVGTKWVELDRELPFPGARAVCRACFTPSGDGSGLRVLRVRCAHGHGPLFLGRY